MLISSLRSASVGAQPANAPACAEYVAGLADGLGLNSAALLEAAEAGHPGRTLTRQHLRSTARSIQWGRGAFVRQVLTEALAAAADGSDD